MHSAKLSLHPGGEHFSTGLFFTDYMIFSDIVGITSYIKGIKPMIFSSVFFQKLHFYVF